MLDRRAVILLILGLPVGLLAGLAPLWVMNSAAVLPGWAVQVPDFALAVLWLVCAVSAIGQSSDQSSAVPVAGLGFALVGLSLLSERLAVMPLVWGPSSPGWVIRLAELSDRLLPFAGWLVALGLLSVLVAMVMLGSVRGRRGLSWGPLLPVAGLVAMYTLAAVSPLTYGRTEHVLRYVTAGPPGAAVLLFLAVAAAVAYARSGRYLLWLWAYGLLALGLAAALTDGFAVLARSAASGYLGSHLLPIGLVVAGLVTAIRWEGLVLVWRGVVGRPDRRRAFGR